MLFTAPALPACYLTPTHPLHSRLQAAAVAMGESLAIPEIVAIGGQSDGKSSLLEAFLGVSSAAIIECSCVASFWRPQGFGARTHADGRVHEPFGQELSRPSCRPDPALRV